MTPTDKKLQIDLYDASNGLTLLICGSIDADFADIHDLFRRLAKERDIEVELHLQEYVNPLRPVEILLSNSTRQERSRMGIHHTEKDRVDWHYTNDDWNHLAELIEELADKPIVGHQYLNLYSHDDMIVVLSKGEYLKRHDSINKSVFHP